MPPTVSKGFDPHSLDSTISHILTRLDEQDRNTARMHEENKTLLSGLKLSLEKFSANFDKRLSSVEKWRWGTAGGLFVIGTALTLYATLHGGH